MINILGKLKTFFERSPPPPEIREVFPDPLENSALCVVPWTHTFISPQSERRMCCASREQSSFINQYLDQPGESGSVYKPVTLKEHWNSEYMRNIRLKMLRGEKLSQCEVCNDKVLNLSTYKNWFNKALFPELLSTLHKNTDKDGHTEMKPISFDYRIHNTCNFKCRMCGEHLSSAWEAEKRANNDWSEKSDPWMIPQVKIKIDEFQKDVVEAELKESVETKSLREIYWVGGEPLVWELHWDLMQRMIDLGFSKQVFCRYNTNLSHINFKGKSLASDLLPHFKAYLICASIDGVGPIGEWIRTGLKWDRFLANFKEMQKGPGGKDSIALDVTLTLPGLFSMKKMFDTAIEIESQIITKVIYAFTPDIVLSPMALPRELLHEILDDLIAYVEPKVTPKTQSLLDTFYELKSRPTFEEAYPLEYQEGFLRGRYHQLKVSARRKDGEAGQAVSLDEIYRENEKVLAWWNRPKNKVMENNDRR